MKVQPKLIPISEPKVGDMIIHHNIIGELKESNWDGKWYIPILGYEMKPEELSTMVGEWTEKQMCNGYKNQPKDVIGFVIDYEDVKKSMPIHSSAWQEILDSGMKEVEMEIKSFYIEPPDSIHCNRGVDRDFLTQPSEPEEKEYTYTDMANLYTWCCYHKNTNKFKEFEDYLQSLNKEDK